MKRLGVRRAAAGLCLLLVVCIFEGGQARALARNLRVAFDCNLPPYQFIDEAGACAGIHVEMMRLIADIKEFDVTFVPMDTDQACRDALAHKEVDLIMGCIRREDSNESAQYTDSITSSVLCMIMENTALQNSAPDAPKIAQYAIFENGTASYSLLSNLHVSAYKGVSNQRAVFLAQREDRKSAMVGVKDSLLYQINSWGLLDEYTITHNYLKTIEYAFLAQAGDRELVRTLNDAIAKLKSSPSYEDICEHWLVVPDSVRNARLFRRLAVVAGATVLCGAIFVFASSRTRRLLQTQVVQQTREIQNANRTMSMQLSQIRNENDLRNRIIKYSPSAMLLFDEQYHVTMINKSALALVGSAYEGEYTCARSLPVFGNIIAEMSGDYFNQLISISTKGIEIPDENGDIRYFRYTMHQVVKFEKVSGILLTVQNITEEKHMQQIAFEAQKNRELNSIIAGIAHEIRNPLMSIRTFATLIGTRGGDQKIRESFATYVPAEVDRINSLIENLIHYSKPKVRHQEQMDVKEMLEECLHLIAPVLSKNRIILRQSIQEGLILNADRDQLKQIMINLIINGIEAMERKRASLSAAAQMELAIEAVGQGERISIAVQDSGDGMSAEEVRNCLNLFFTTKKTGTGLGLPLSAQLLAENGGTMQIESVETQYTRFTIHFRRYHEAESSDH